MISPTVTAFIGDEKVASGPLEDVLPSLKAWFDQDQGAMFLIFEDETGKALDFDLRGPLPHVMARHNPSALHQGPGRPKLGVVSREVSLLPRHWEWLEGQPNGASAAIRRLVEEARKVPSSRAAKEALGRVMTAIAGDRPNYEEATRALYAGRKEDFAALIAGWPKDVRAYILKLSEPAFMEAT